MLPLLLCVIATAARAAESGPSYERTLVMIRGGVEQSTPAELSLQTALVAATNADGRALGVFAGTEGAIAADLANVYPEAVSLLLSADALYNALELDAARDKYAQAAERLEAAQSSLGLYAPVLIYALAMQSAVHLLYSEQAQAEKTLGAVFALSPDYVPSPAVFNPKMLEAFESIRERTSGDRKATLTIAADVDGAAIFLDGRWLGPSPVTADRVAKGKHYIVAVGPAGVPKGALVKVGAKKAQKAAITLTEAEVPFPSWDGGDMPDLPEGARQRATDLDCQRVVLVRQGRDADSWRVRMVESSGTRVYAKEVSGAADSLASYLDLARSLLTPPEVVAAALVAAPPPPSLWDTVPRTSAALYGAGALLAGVAGFLGYLALLRNDEFYLERAKANDQFAFDHARTTDQIEGAAVAENGRLLALASDLSTLATAATMVAGAWFHWRGVEVEAASTISRGASGLTLTATW